VRSELEINRAVDQYADMIRRICICHLKNASDTEDIFQTVFLPVAMPELEDNPVLAAVQSLPLKYRNAIYLHYYEGYSAAEIGGILRKKENTIYSLLSRGRAMLKEALGGEL